MTSRLYRHVPETQEAAIAALTERYAGQKIRFDTGFVGSVPVQASGRIGKRFFYFRFRGDTASLTVGSQGLRQAAGYFKRDRTKALRTLRRWKDSGESFDLGRFIAQRDLKRSTTLDRHPSIPIRYAAITDVTGDPYNGFLETDEAADLFIRLMDNLQSCSGRRPSAGKYRALIRGSYTMPANHRQGIIRKPSKHTR